VAAIAEDGRADLQSTLGKQLVGYPLNFYCEKSGSPYPKCSEEIASEYPEALYPHSTGISTDPMQEFQIAWNKLVQVYISAYFNGPSEIALAAYPQASPNVFWNHSLAVYGGNSGGPVFVNRNGRWEVAAVVSREQIAASAPTSNVPPAQPTSSGSGVRVLDSEAVSLIQKVIHSTQR
jgi:hypothetical protein